MSAFDDVLVVGLEFREFDGGVSKAHGFHELC